MVGPEPAIVGPGAADCPSVARSQSPVARSRRLSPVVSSDLDGSTPVYRQIANGLRRHLVDARFKPGDLLPPIRQIALDLGVHFNTVAQAYRILADEGWIDLRRRRGATVLSRDTPRNPDPRRIDSLLRRVADLATELRSAGMSRTEIAKRLRQAAAGVDR